MTDAQHNGRRSTYWLMALDFTQQPGDDGISVRVTEGGQILIEHGFGEWGKGRMQVSPYNAAQLLAGLSMVLNLPLTKESMKAIKI